MLSTVNKEQDAISRPGPAVPTGSLAGDYDPAKFGMARIVHRREVAANLWVIRITTDFALSFRPGQHAVFGLYVDGRLVEHAYSMCSAPDEDEIELFIERLPEGRLTVPLHGLGVGADIPIRRQCQGVFLKEGLTETSRRLFVATVTGVAPFVSLIRSLRHLSATSGWRPDGQVVLLHGASFSHELGYLDELRHLDQQLDWLTYIPTVSRPWGDADWSGEMGRVEDLVRKYADKSDIRPGRATVHACGHPEMIRNVRAIMLRAGFDDAFIHEEPYVSEE